MGDTNEFFEILDKNKLDKSSGTVTIKINDNPNYNITFTNAGANEYALYHNRHLLNIKTKISSQNNHKPTAYVPQK